MTTYRKPDNSKLYKQADKRWAYDAYPTKNYTFAKNGCGCCAVTHCVIEMPKYANYTPKHVRPYMVQFATKGNGTMWNGITAGLKHFGFKNVKESVKDPKVMTGLWDELKRGDAVGVLLFTNKKGPDGTVWTMGGHYIAVVGMKIVNGKHYLWLKDSGSRHGSKFYCYETSMRGCIRKFWTGRIPSTEIRVPEGGFKLNDKSPEIKKIQSFLKMRGFYKGKIGGRYGLLTKAAVKKFQAKYGLVQDGVWGPKTNAKYEEVK